MMNGKNNPWLGLNTYTENDKLYGRDAEVAEVADIVLNNIQTVVYGRSGIGKSSLLQSGVFPRLRYDDFLPVYIRLEHNATDSYIVQIYSRLKEEAVKNDIEISVGNIPSSLSELLCSIRMQDKRTGFIKYPVFVFDQFEEIFTLTDSIHKAHVTDFFSQLAVVLNDNVSDYFRIVICLREDYLYFLEQNSVDIPCLKRNRYCLKPLDRNQGRDVICMPHDGLVSVEIANLILDKIDNDKTDVIAPAILSLFMHELFEKGDGVITAENIQKFGDNIISDFYEEGMVIVSPESRAFLEDRLVTTDGYRHYLSYNDALANGVTLYEMDSLRNKRIITIEKGDRNQRIIELSHDVLCPVVLKSRDERKHRKEAEQLRMKTKKMRKRQQIILALFVIAFVLVGIFAFMFIKIREQRDAMFVNQSRFVAKEAMELAKSGDYIKAMALVAEVYPKNVDNPERPLVQEAYDALRVLNDSTAQLGKVLCGHTGKINSVQLTPDESRVVILSDSVIRFYDINTGELRHILDVKTCGISPIRFSPDGIHFSVFANDNTIRLYDLSTYECKYVLKGHKNKIKEIHFNYDGNQIATIDYRGIVMLWDIQLSDKSLCVLDDNSRINSIVGFTSDSNSIIIVLRDDTIQYRDTKTGRILYVYKRKGRFFHVNNTIIADFSFWTHRQDNDSIVLYDTQKRKYLHTFIVNGEFIKSIQLNCDKETLLVLTSGGIVKLWNIKSGKYLYSIKINPKTINIAKFSLDGKMIVTISNDNTIQLWNVKTGKTLYDLKSYNSYSSYGNIQFNEDCTRMLLETRNNGIEVWNIEDEVCLCNIKKCDRGQLNRDGNKFIGICNDNAVIGNVLAEDCSKVLSGHRLGINTAYFNSTATKCVTASRDNTVRLWDVFTGKCLHVLTGHNDNVYSAKFNIDGSKVISDSEDGTIKIWDSQTSECLYSFKKNGNKINSLIFSTDGHKMLTSDETMINVWNLNTGDCLFSKSLPYIISHVSLNSKGTEFVVSFFRDSIFQLWNVESEKCIYEQKVSAPIENICFSKNDNEIYVFSSNKGTDVWDIKTGKNIYNTRNLSYWFDDKTFDGKVAGVSVGHVYIIDIKSGHITNTLFGNFNLVYSIDFNYVGQLAVLPFDSNIISVWNMNKGKRMLTLYGHTKSINSMKFSSDGKKILTASDDATARIWDIPDPQELIDRTISKLNGYKLSKSDRIRYYLE